jgi:hypothetical protein
MRRGSSGFFGIAGNLFLIHLLFIIITLITLQLRRFSVITPFCYLLVLFLAGWRCHNRLSISPLTTLAAGYLSQLPGIIAALLIITGELWPSDLAVFEFIAQIWQTPLYPLYPLLPRAAYGDVPLYFLITINASFVLPLIPAAGSSLSRLAKTIETRCSNR